MTFEEFNELVDQLYALGESYEEALQAVYLKAFKRAANHAESEFRATALTAAAFVAPPPEQLATGLTESEREQTASVRDRLLDDIATLLIVLGLGAVAVSFKEAIAGRGDYNFEREVLQVLRNVVNRGVNLGWTVDETAVALQEAFAGLSSPTAQMLAQTELTTIVNERSLMAAQRAFGERTAPTYKVWQTRMDGRVRPAHSAAQSQTVPISQPFSVGGYPMMYPGDPSAPMTLVARCRCRMTYSTTLTASAKEATVSSMATTATNVPVKTSLRMNLDQEALQQALVAAITITIADDDEAEATVSEPGTWRALLAIEGQPTDDGRMIEVGALTWREPPLSLMALTETGMGGHVGAELAGKIMEIHRDGENGAELWGTGEFDTGEYGQEVRRMVGEETLRGNSVDLAVSRSEYRNAETGEVLEGDALYEAFFDDVPLLFVVLEGVILASTVCPTPAINGAEIMLASGMLVHRFSFAPRSDEEVLTASAAGMVPLHPPAEWFDDPNLDGPTPITVTSEGRVYGHAALWNSCHIGEPHGPGICVPPPRSGMSYEIFHHGAVETDEGIDVPCGQITMSTTHAGRDLGWKAAQEHYENTGIAVADVRAGEDRHGIWLSGSIRPDVPAERVREMKAGAISGDWRQIIDRGLEFLGALVVSIPGFPIPRPEAVVVASAEGEEEVLALVAAGMVTDEDVEEMTRSEYLRKVGALTR